ncbi:hypothetical protein GCM10011574_55920 [Microbispora bryophytorum]|uniref:Uncharacterized protein n=1 Tax=Microbispora bryophytorum TaxID=1460882 RepID=A0A8H9LG78_9ACTN|nr:hypothetical protein GCM10011574_55920 [Microbispora bryophytorum]
MTVDGQPAWSEWLASLDGDVRDKAMVLRDRFEALGALEPEEWARAEVRDGIAHLARFRLLRGLWSEHIDPQRDAVETWIANTRRELARDSAGPFSDAGKALLRMVDELGVTPGEVGALARLVAYKTIFGVLYGLDEPNLAEDDVPEILQEQLPSWLLVEVVGKDLRLTGRVLTGLHEDLLTMDPSGRDGRAATDSE